MSASWAVPGAKCIFVGGGKFPPPSSATGSPVHGAEYTIREVSMFPQGLSDGHRSPYYIRLHETVVKPHGKGWEDSWMCLAGFRPLITRTQSQDLELFVPLLTRVGEPA